MSIRNSGVNGLLTISTLLLILMTCTPTIHAHMMAAQGGTLNFVEDDVFMVLSIPVSAFELKDSDGNNAISMIEFNRQRDRVMMHIRDRVILSDDSGPLILQGIMLSPERDHNSEQENISQLVVLGKFTFGEDSKELSFSTDLFGSHSDEQEFNMAARRKPSGIEHLFQISPDKPSQILDAELLKSYSRSD